MSETPTAALSPAELRAEAILERQEALTEFEATVTQREWLICCNKLERTREQIAVDGSLRLLALGWIKEKRDHGGASWDRLLDMTDRQLLDLWGFPAAEEVLGDTPAPEATSPASGATTDPGLTPVNPQEETNE